MRQVNMLEAKTQLSRLVEAVESGQEKEIVLARGGKPAAKLVPIGAGGGIRLGLADGRYPAFDAEAFEAMDAEIETLFLGRDA